MPACNIVHGHVSLQKLELQWSKKEFLVVQHGFQLEGMKVPRVHKGQREPQDTTKGLINERPSASPLLDELPIEKCQFRNPVSRQSI